MKTVALAISILLFPVLASAENTDEHFVAESGVDALQGNFSSDNDARLSVTRWQPFLRLEWGHGSWLSSYSVIATEATTLGYEQRLTGDARIRMDLSSGGNIFLAQGLNVNILRYGRFRLGAQLQYEFALWDLRGSIQRTRVWQDDLELDLTEEARDHVVADYSWQRLHVALRAEYAIWRFTPYIMFGWSVLDADLTFRYDEEARSALALFGYETAEISRDHYRGGAILGMLGSEFRIWRGFSANLAGAAVPDKHGWIFAGRASLIWRP